MRNKRENYFSKYFEWNRIYMAQSVFKFKKLKNKRERNLLRINLNGIRLYTTQNQFSSSKSLKARERNFLGNNLIAIGLHITQNQFSSSKSEKQEGELFQQIL